LIIAQGTPASTLVLPSIKWAGGTAYAIGTAGTTDIISLLYDGTNYYGAFMGAFA
jgi:hypothetical protein